MTTIRVGVVDVHVISAVPGAPWRVLALRRGPDTRCTGAWEAVHGKIEASERPEDAAIREVREETGLEVERLYNVTVNPFYVHRTATLEMAIVFAAFTAPGEVKLAEEHSEYEWLSVEAALQRFAWPRERGALADIVALLQSGDAGPLEDVLRV